MKAQKWYTDGTEVKSDALHMHKNTGILHNVLFGDIKSMLNCNRSFARSKMVSNTGDYTEKYYRRKAEVNSWKHQEPYILKCEHRK